uniref:RRM domain-containing protein n=1 Tax=Spongospora subterranea TaxID=70186 RepID=A0A0H5RCJ5_9EUKA|eukprot:CRZ11471.1 hypothetical protein [Spongospora subterranea]
MSFTVTISNGKRRLGSPKQTSEKQRVLNGNEDSAGLQVVVKNDLKDVAPSAAARDGSANEEHRSSRSRYSSVSELKHDDDDVESRSRPSKYIKFSSSEEGDPPTAWKPVEATAPSRISLLLKRLSQEQVSDKVSSMTKPADASSIRPGLLDASNPGILLVRNLPPDITGQEVVMKIFAKHDILSADLHFSDKSEPYAEVLFPSFDVAADALQLNIGRKYRGYRLKMTLLSNYTT